MAEFGASVTEAPQTPNAITPQEGIVKEPIGVQGIANIFGGIREARAEGRAKKGDAFISQFSNEQLGIIQAVDQGKMTSQAARTRIRTNLMTAINNYPSLRKELIQSNSAILGTAGMGGVVTDGTKEEIRRENLQNAMVQEGLVSPDASPEEFSQAEQNFMLAQESKRRYDAVMDTIGLEKAKTGLTKDKLELLEAKEERAATEYLTGTAPALMEQFKNTANQLLSVIGTEGYEEGNVVSLIEERFVEFEQSLSVPLSQTDSHTASALMKGFREYKDIVVKRAKGEFGQEEYDRRIKRITSQQELMALNDPVLARAVALSNLGLSDLLLSEKLPVMRRAGQFLGDNADEASPAANLFTDTAEGRKAANAYFSSIAINPTTLTDEQKEEQLRHLTKIMDGVEDYESFLQKNPERGISMVTDWMSKQEFYNLRKEYPEAFENNTTAMRILQSNYGDQVWDMIDKEFNKNNVIRITEAPTGGARDQMQGTATTGKTTITPTPEAVTYQATSNGMEFLAVDKKDAEAVAKAKKLNKELAPIINKNIKAFAHLEGSNNYQQYWEKVDETYMTGGVGQTQTGGGAGEDDLEGGLGNDRIDIEDFRQDIASAEPLASEDIVDLRSVPKGKGFTHGKKMESVDGMVIHHTGGRGTAEDIARVLDERGLSVQFVIDREGKVVQLMDDNAVAWHAGKNNTSGFDNNNTVGVEIIGKDDGDILPIQVEAAKRLAKTLSERHGFNMENVFGHGEVASHKRKTEGQAVITALRGNRAS